MSKRNRFFGLMIAIGVIFLSSGLSYAQMMANEKLIYHAPYTVRWTQCAFGNDGRLWVVWIPGDTDPKSASGHIYCSIFDGTTVTDPFMVSANDSLQPNRPHITVSPKGHILVTWGIRSNMTVQMRIWSPNTKSWGPIETVCQGYGDWETCAQIDANKNVHVLFMKEGAGMVMVRSRINGVWEGVVKLSESYGKQGTLCLSSNGVLNAIWVEKNGAGHYTNRRCRRVLPGGWGDREGLPGVGGASNHPWLAVGPNNVPVVAWMDITNPDKEDGAEIRVLQIGTNTPRAVVSPFYAQHFPRVAVDPDNNIHVATQIGAGASGIGIRYTNNVGGTWKPVQTIVGGFPKVAGLAVDPFGNAAVCLSSYASGGGTDIWAYSLKPIEDIPMPEADFSFTPTTGYPPLSVGIHAVTAHSPNGQEVTYDWTFSEGGTATGRNISHLYATHGTFTITLTITDNLGRTSEISKTITIMKTNPQAPLNPSAKIVMSSMWSNPQITYTLRWETNPANVPEHIEAYAIYMKEGDGEYVKILNLSPSTVETTFPYTDLRVKRSFAIRTLGYGGTESSMVYFQ